ncbi:MAG: hypothetical protein ABJN35_05110 [Erythrobacter sp.]
MTCTNTVKRQRARLRGLGSIAAVMVMAAPVHAQGFETYVSGVGFFERATVGDLDVTPFGIVRDTRCADIRFCTRENTLFLSVILHDYRGMREIVLELDEPVAVPGGYLILRGAGTRPSERSAIRLSEYALDLEFVSLRFDELR